MSKKILGLLVLMIVCGIYIASRVFQGLPFIKIYADELIGIVKNGRNISYDERMDKAMGKDYYLIRQIKIATPENSTICFFKKETAVNIMQAAYFLYPRTLKKIETVKNEPCNYLFVDDKYQYSDIKVKGMVVFGTDIKSLPEKEEVTRYTIEKFANNGRYGLLQL